MLFDDVCMRMTVSGDGAPRNRRVLGCGHPYSGAMRWEGLFADLEGQLAAEERRELDDEVAERTRRERALVTLADRLAGAVGSTVRLGLGAGLHVQGDIADLGDGWVLLRDPATGREHLVPTAAVVTVSALGARVETARAARRFGLGYALRALSRELLTDADWQANYDVITRFLNCSTPSASPFITKPESGNDPHGGGDLWECTPGACEPITTVEQWIGGG